METQKRSLNLRSFFNRVDAEVVGDIVYMPNTPSIHERVAAFPQLKEVCRTLPAPANVRIASCGSAQLASIVIESLAIEEAGGGGMRQPTWFTQLPAPYRAIAQIGWCHRYHENPQILSAAPVSGLPAYSVDIGATLLGGAFRAFRLYRLADIRQLAWITTPVMPDDMERTIPTRYDHTRLCHVWDVAAIANLLARATGLHPGNARTLVLAAATHDACTPAGGDTTKLLDRAFFDEDARYHTQLEMPEVKAVLQEYRIAPGLLNRTVCGEGLLGQLLDVADKTAYVMRDAAEFHGRLSDTLSDSEEGEKIHALMATHGTNACAAWQYITRQGKRVLCTDPEALARFLYLRALLFRALYWHPNARYAEFIVGHLVLRALIVRGDVKKEHLLEWTDWQLDQVVERYARLTYATPDFGEPRHEGFATEAAMRARADALRTSGEHWVMTETLPPRIASGTHIQVRDGQGIGSLAARCPDLAAPIDALAETVDPFRVYWVPLHTMSQRLRSAMRDLTPLPESP